VKLVSRDSDQFVFRLEPHEYETLRALLALRPRWPPRRRPLTGDTASTASLQQAEQELVESLGAHRNELTAAMAALLADPVRCASQSDGIRLLTLDTSEGNQLLRALNELHVGAWERLGSPDMELSRRPEITQENFLFVWAMDISELFEARLLDGLMGDEVSGEEADAAPN
jgi:hypothetical protein